MIKAVLFDLDGTLVNSLEDLATSTNFALAEFGFPTHDTECYKYFVGDGMLKLIERALPENRSDSETVISVHKVFMAHYGEHFADKTKVYNGIKDVLLKLRESGIKTAVISNKAQEMAVEVVEKIIGGGFQIVCGKQEGFPTKPDPTLTLRVIKELGLKPENCVFVGDSGMDALTAVNVGCIGLGVLWGFRTREELLENGAHYIAEKPSDIIKILKEIGI